MTLQISARRRPREPLRHSYLAASKTFSALLDYGPKVPNALVQKYCACAGKQTGKTTGTNNDGTRYCPCAMLAKETEHAEIFYWCCEMCCGGLCCNGRCSCITTNGRRLCGPSEWRRQGRGGDERH